jgi:hypothetical protein
MFDFEFSIEKIGIFNKGMATIWNCIQVYIIMPMDFIIHFSMGTSIPI